MQPFLTRLVPHRTNDAAVRGACSLVACVALLAGLSVPLAVTAGDDEAGPLALGSTLPVGDVGMLNVDGEEITIDSIRGEKGTLVIFSCNTCPWAKAWEDRIAELGNSVRQEGLGVIVVNSNDPNRVPTDGYEPMQERAKEKGFEFPYVVDATSNVARAFGASRTPECFLFDATGQLVYHGAVDDNAKQPDEVEARWLTDAVTALLAGKAVEVAETKALGCSIKFRPET